MKTSDKVLDDLRQCMGIEGGGVSNNEKIQNP